MAEIFRFPDKSARTWATIEEEIRNQLDSCGASSDMENEVCNRLKEYYEKVACRTFRLDVALPIPESATEEEAKVITAVVRKAFSQLESQIHEFTTHILMDRMLLEIVLYNQKQAS